MIKRIKNFIVFGFFMLTILVFSGNVEAEICNRLVAIVNNDIITLHELHKKMKEITGYDADKIKENSQVTYEKMRTKVLEKLIETKITNKKIEELNIEIKEKEVEDAIKHMMRENQWSNTDFKNMLKDRGISEDVYKESVKEDLQRYKLIDFEVKSKIIIRDEQIEEYYNNHKSEFHREKGVELATIFIARKTMNADEEAIKIEEKGEKILDALKKGADFSEMVSKYSDGPGVREGGYLGRFDPNLLEPEIRKIVENTPEGGYSDLLIKPNGVQIIKVLSNSDGGTMSLEKARGAIYGILMREEINRRYSEWIEKLKQDTYVKIFY